MRSLSLSTRCEPFRSTATLTLCMSSKVMSLTSGTFLKIEVRPFVEGFDDDLLPAPAGEQHEGYVVTGRLRRFRKVIPSISGIW